MGLAAISRTFSTSDIRRQAFRTHTNYYSFHDTASTELIIEHSVTISPTSRTVRDGKSYYRSEFARKLGLDKAPSGPASLSPEGKAGFIGENLCIVEIDGYRFSVVPNMAPYCEGENIKGEHLTSFMLVPIFDPNEVPQYPSLSDMPEKARHALFKLVEMINEELPLGKLLLNWSPFASILPDKSGKLLPMTQSILFVHVHYLPKLSPEISGKSDRPMTAEEFARLQPSQKAFILGNDPLNTSLAKAILERLKRNKEWQQLSIDIHPNHSNRAILTADLNKPITQINPEMLDNALTLYFRTLDGLSRGLTQAMLKNGKELTGIYRQILKTEDPKVLLEQMQSKFLRVHEDTRLLRSSTYALQEARRLGIPDSLIRQIYSLGPSSAKIMEAYKLGLGACAGLTTDATGNVSIQAGAGGHIGAGASLETLSGIYLNRNHQDTPSSTDEHSYLQGQRNILKGIEVAVRKGGGTVQENALWKPVLP